MIDFRYHLVSIISIFLALAVGIVLGAGPLKGSIGTTLTTELANARKDKAQLNDDLTAARRLQAASNTFAASALPGIVSGTLAGRGVVVVLGPQASDAARKGVQDAVSRAGGTVAVTVALQPSFLDSAHATARDQLVASLAPALGVDAGDPERAGAVLGRALLQGAAGTTPADAAHATAAVGALADGGYLKTDRAGKAPAPTLAVVVPGPLSTTSSAETSTWTDGYLGLARGLDAAAAGTVMAAPVAGSDAQASAATVVSAARASNGTSQVVSTVDDVDLAMGEAALALALAGELKGQVGRYGVLDDAQAVTPTLPKAGS